nr:hypothetical protein [Tanacetum cinerariifolium]
RGALHYIPGLEEPQTPPAPQDEDEHEHMFIQPHDPDFMPEPIYHEYIPLEDEHILPAEEQPLPPVVSPTAESQGDDDDGDSSGDDADDEDEDEEDEEEEEEEHLAPADSAVVIPTDELVSPLEGTEPAAISFPPEAKVKRLLAMPTPSPSPLTSLSPPSVRERIARCMAPAALPSPPLPPPLHMPPPVDRRDDILETEMPPRKRLCLFTLGSRERIARCIAPAALPSPPLPPPLHMPPPVDRRDDILETEMPPRKRLCLFTLGSSTLDVEARRRGIGEVG